MTWEIDQSDKIIIVGYSGAGKSTLLKFFIDNYFIKFENLVIVDPTAKFSFLEKREYFGVVKCLNPRKNKICVKLSGENQIEKLISVINRYDKPVFLVVDEIDGFIPVYFLPYQFGIYSEQGRNWNQGGIFTVRRIGALNKSIFSNSHYLIMFKIYNQRDVAYLEQTTDINVRELISKLGEHDFFVIDLHFSKVIGHFVVSGNKLKSLTI